MIAMYKNRQRRQDNHNVETEITKTRQSRRRIQDQKLRRRRKEIDTKTTRNQREIETQMMINRVEDNKKLRRQQRGIKKMTLKSKDRGI